MGKFKDSFTYHSIMEQNRKCVKDCWDRNPNIYYQIKEDIDCEAMWETTSHTCQVGELIILRSTSYLQWFKTWVIPPNLKEREEPSGEWADRGVWHSTQKKVALKHRSGTFCKWLVPFLHLLLFWFRRRSHPTKCWHHTDGSSDTTITHINLSDLGSHILFDQRKIWEGIIQTHPPI